MPSYSSITVFSTFCQFFSLVTSSTLKLQKSLYLASIRSGIRSKDLMSLSVNITLAPSSKRSFPLAKPSPDAPPVISATLSLTLFIIIN